MEDDAGLTGEAAPRRSAARWRSSDDIRCGEKDDIASSEDDFS